MFFYIHMNVIVYNFSWKLIFNSSLIELSLFEIELCNCVIKSLLNLLVIKREILGFFSHFATLVAILPTASYWTVKLQQDKTSQIWHAEIMEYMMLHMDSFAICNTVTCLCPKHMRILIKCISYDFHKKMSWCVTIVFIALQSPLLKETSSVRTKSCP